MRRKSDGTPGSLQSWDVDGTWGQAGCPGRGPDLCLPRQWGEDEVLGLGHGRSGPGEGDDRPTPAGAGGRCTQTSPHKTLLTILWNKAPQNSMADTHNHVFLSLPLRAGLLRRPGLGSVSGPSLPLGVLKAGLGLPGPRREAVEGQSDS